MVKLNQLLFLWLINIHLFTFLPNWSFGKYWDLFDPVKSITNSYTVWELVNTNTLSLEDDKVLNRRVFNENMFRFNICHRYLLQTYLYDIGLFMLWEVKRYTRIYLIYFPNYLIPGLWDIETYEYKAYLHSNI